jgi:hypothetical protein
MSAADAAATSWQLSVSVERPKSRAHDAHFRDGSIVDL